MGLEEKLLSGFCRPRPRSSQATSARTPSRPPPPAWHAAPSSCSRPAAPRHDLACFGMERASATPRQADLMILVGRVSQKMTSSARSTTRWPSPSVSSPDSHASAGNR